MNNDLPPRAQIMQSVDLVFGAEALEPPLTGIGRYSFELARRLAKHDGVSRLRFFALGRWVDMPVSHLAGSLPTGAETPQDESNAGVAVSLSGVLRRALSDSRLAVRLYQAAMPKVSGWRLRGNAGAVFHAPNYIVPPFDGRAVSTVHDLSHVLYPEFHPQARVDYLNLALPASLKHTDHVITVSHTVRQEFIRHFGWPPERVTAIHNGVDAVFAPRPVDVLQQVLAPLDLQANGYALYVGTIEPRKNLKRLLGAYAALPVALRREIPLVVAGTLGWRTEDLLPLLQRGQDEGWLRYLRFVPQAQLPTLYAGARLLAYVPIYEGFGLPIVEAMASGTPVLTSNTSCMPEIAGGAARLVDPLDESAIAEALFECLQDDSWRALFRERGLLRAREFSWDRCVEETLNVYRRTML